MDDLSCYHILGGLPLGPDGRAHGTYRHDPSTLRLSMASPNLTNIPRGGTPLQDLVRGMFVAPAGKLFVARDFSGIEGVLTGFFANAARIIRIFKLDGHSFFTAHALHLLDKILPAADLPQESWSDADLLAYFKHFKPKYKDRRNTNKKITHGANYMETAPMAQVILLNDLGVLWPVKDIARVMDVYHELFPEIRRWHNTLAAQCGGVDVTLYRNPPQLWGCDVKHTYVRTPFNAIHRYYDTVRWKKSPLGQWEWDFGDDAKRLAALLPQSTARFCLTRAAQRIWDNPNTQDVAQAMRLFIHDELLLECAEADADRFDAVLEQEMQRPIPELTLPEGTALALGSEGKRGTSWKGMK